MDPDLYLAKLTTERIRIIERRLDTIEKQLSNTNSVTVTDKAAYDAGWNAAMDEVMNYIRIEDTATVHEIYSHCNASKVDS